MKSITDLWDKLMVNVPNAIEALILLIIAFICAAIVKSLVTNTMRLLKVDTVLDKASLDKEKKTSFKDFIAKLFYLITFALFVPGIFQKLGLTGVADPVIAMMDKLLVYMPNIVAGAVILVIGLFIAKIIKELLVPIFKKLNIDSYLTKVWFESNDKFSLAELFANVVYILVLIPIVIASLDALKIEAISKPAIEMLNDILVFLPRIAIAIVILFVGKFIADLVGQLLEKLLVSIGTDKATQSLLVTSGTKTEKEFSLSRIIALTVKYVIIIFFLVEGLNILKLEILTNIGNDIITYMPYAISSAIILGIAVLVGNFVESNISKKLPENKILALIIKIVIITIGVFITLYQLGIAKALINSAFIIILGAFAVAFAVAFGIGGRDFAKSMLAKLEKRIDNKQQK